MLNPSPVTVTLVDDNDLSIVGLRTLLAPHAERVELLDLRTALASPNELDLVLHEPFLASPTVVSLFEQLSAASGAVSVTFSWAGPQDVAGGEGRPYLSKGLTASQLVRALEDLHSGRPAPAPPAQSVMRSTPPAALPPADAVSSTCRTRPPLAISESLTAREVEVLTLITRGLSNVEVGEELGLSINSIKSYVRTAYRKIGVSRRTHAVAWGLEHGLLDMPTGAETDLLPV